MDLKENFKNLREKMGNLKRKEIKGWKDLLFFLIIVDIFGIYWYLELKKLGIAFLFIFLVFLGYLLFLENNLPLEKIKKKKIHNNVTREGKNKMPEEKEEKNEEIEENEDDGGFDLGLDLGLPNADEYKKRMEDALGTM